jgi:hypothetical protein
LEQVARAYYNDAVCGGGGTITSVIPQTHQAKAAYRLLDCESVMHPAVIQPHCQLVRSQLDSPGVTLLIEDTTAISYPTLKASKGLGPIGESFTSGYWLHSTLAVHWEESDKPGGCWPIGDRCWPIGLVHQQAWARSKRRPKRPKSKGRGKECNNARQLRTDRESIRWASVLADLPEKSCADAQWIYVADRESDIYEVFGKCRNAGVSMVIRAAYPRAIAKDESQDDLIPEESDLISEASDLMSAAADAPVLGQLELYLVNHNRTARLEVRATSLELQGPPRPGGRLENVGIHVVRVREIGVPEGVEPLEWTLLTDLPVTTLKECERVIRIYRVRWLIEEFHKAIKTGLGLELSQLSDYRRLSVLGGILSVVSVHLLQLKWKARTDGDRPLSKEEQDEPMVKVLSQIHPAQGKPTQGWMLKSMARVGGYQARKSDGPPGWLTIWRGWQTLQFLVQGYELASG